MHQYPIYLSSCGALEKLNHCAVHLAFQLEIKICQPLSLKSDFSTEGKGNIQTRENSSVGLLSDQTRQASPGVCEVESISGVSGVGAGRLWLKTKER